MGSNQAKLEHERKTLELKQDHEYRLEVSLLHVIFHCCDVNSLLIRPPQMVSALQCCH